ncbi:MAG: hypothetical protein Q9191_004453 [Dirinaria sp. TL-2023a]
MIGLMWPLLVVMPRAFVLATSPLNPNRSPEALATRSYFYVGGEYVDDGTGMHLFTDQMYVEKLVPQGGAKHQEAIIFIHGQAQTGTTGEKGDPVFDAFYASQVQFQNNTVIVESINQRAGAALLDRIGPATIITHSQGGTLGFLIADARPALVKALVSLEPQGPPFEDRVSTNSTAVTRPYGLTNIPITYSPPVVDPATDLSRKRIPPAGPGLSECVMQASPAKKLPNLARIPQMVVTSEASYHAVYDYCTVRYLQQAGVMVDFLNLPAFGIHGNAHFLFLEKNNIEIAAAVEAWIRSKL